MDNGHVNIIKIDKLNTRVYYNLQEIGSPQLPEFLKNNREVFACDLILNADSGQWSEDQPSLLTSLRGLCGLQVDVTGADSDLHSGMYGGAVQNPIHALIQILNSMRGSDGRILIEGFYDNVRVLSDSEKAQIDSIPLFIREGGSVPILSLFLEHLGVYATCFGFGMNDEKFHAPDEFFRLKNFELGQRAYCKILHRLGHQK